ncbi:MAG: hypothetical protein R3B48_17075 [Kofleriaceae bacterium]
MSAPACVPIAVGSVAVGGAGVVLGVVEYEDCSDGPDNYGICGLGNALATLVILVGGVLAAGGGIYLAR